MRMYQEIWERLKTLPREEAKKVGVRVSVPPHLHKRTIKAVIKEKDEDLVFKLLMDSSRVRLTHSRVGAIITFRLKFPISVEDV